MKKTPYPQVATGAGGGVDQLTPLEALELEDDDEGDGVFGQRRDPRLHLMKKNKTKENQLRGTRLPWQVSFFLCRGGRWRPYRIFSSFFWDAMMIVSTGYAARPKRVKDKVCGFYF